MTSTVPTPHLGPTGYVIPAEADILAAVFSDINDAFGGGLSQNLETPQGQLASSITAIIADMHAQFLDVTSRFDPRYSYGRMQDAIGQIYFIERIPASSTLVNCVCTGIAGTVIPANTLAKDSSGNVYSCASGGQISINGTVNLIFANIIPGPIPCLPGQLNIIYGAINGWDTILNQSDGIIGRNVETSQEFEFRRKNSVALNSTQNLAAVYSAVAVSGLTLTPPLVPLDVYVAENKSDLSTTLGEVSLLPHSLYVAVVGGNATEIAKAIYQKSSFGCAYNGEQAVIVQDTVNYSFPYPSYTIRYTVPASFDTKFIVTLINNPQLPSTISELIEKAIIDAFAGLDEGPRARIGATVYASRFYAPIAALDPSVGIVSILVGHDTADSNSMNVRIDQFPVVSAGNIQVVLV